jgi:hypothetical protein
VERLQPVHRARPALIGGVRCERSIVDTERDQVLSGAHWQRSNSLKAWLTERGLLQLVPGLAVRASRVNRIAVRECEDEPTGIRGALERVGERAAPAAQLVSELGAPSHPGEPCSADAGEEVRVGVIFTEQDRSRGSLEVFEMVQVRPQNAPITWSFVDSLKSSAYASDEMDVEILPERFDLRAIRDDPVEGRAREAGERLATEGAACCAIDRYDVLAGVVRAQQVLDSLKGCIGGDAGARGVIDPRCVDTDQHGSLGGFATVVDRVEKAVRPVSKSAVLIVVGEAHGSVTRLVVLIEDGDLHVVGRKDLFVNEVAEAVHERLGVRRDQQLDRPAGASALEHRSGEHASQLCLMRRVEVQLGLFDGEQRSVAVLPPGFANARGPEDRGERENLRVAETDVDEVLGAAARRLAHEDVRVQTKYAEARIEVEVAAGKVGEALHVLRRERPEEHGEVFAARVDLRDGKILNAVAADGRGAEGREISHVRGEPGDGSVGNGNYVIRVTAEKPGENSRKI